MEVEVFNQENKIVGKINLPSEIFEVRWHPDLVHQVVVAQLANRRKNIAHTKTRGEVRGGGRKPWVQKGTGRARHGSIRSPLWKGGGVVFGPRKEKIYAKKINKKMKRLALFSLLSKKQVDNELKVVDHLKLEEAKTKKVANILKNFFDKKSVTVSFVVSKNNKDFSKAARNIPGVIVLKANSLDLYNLLTHKYLFFEKGAIDDLKEIYLKNE